MNTVLIVDDELSIRESFSLILEDKYRLLTAASGEGAIKQVAGEKIDLVYLDIRMPGLNGLEALKRIKEVDPQVEVVMVTAVNDVQKASEAIKLGARDYLIKPFDVDSILKMTELILRRRLLTAEKEGPRLIGLETVLKAIEKAAATDKKVLIAGEEGTEKEVVARLIHGGGQRSELPFLSFPLSEKMTASSVRTKLFGMETGSTAATLKKKSGLLDEIRGGTLFLDHAENLPPALLSVFPSGVRLIGGTSIADIPQQFKENFDLITIPPLRERMTDIPPLVSYFIDNFNGKYLRNVEKAEDEVQELLSGYSWPGNTKELECLMERLVLNCRSKKIAVSDLPFDILLTGAKPYGSEYLSRFARGRTRTDTAYSAEGF